MKIHNIRLGHATNSSSSHSIIMGTTHRQFLNDRVGQFGWENFLLKTPAAKLDYLAVTLWHNLIKLDFTEAKAVEIIKELWPNNGIWRPAKPLPQIAGAISDVDGFEDYSGPNIDHQSVLTYPAKYGTKTKLDMTFVKEFTNYITNNPKLAIAGGNDNSDAYDYGGAAVTYLPSESRNMPICRRDATHWVIFNRETGGKVRVSFDDIEITHGSTPELVDLKITDYCPYGCEWCYQGSTKKGKHASLESIKRVVNVLKRLKVFEIAIGGGEPTLHPNFVEIIKYIAAAGIVPNFTTFVPYHKWKSVVGLCGGVGVSVNGEKELEKIEALDASVRDDYDVRRKITIQTIMGVSSTETMSKLIKMAEQFNVLLLGYKRHGRGTEIAPISVDARVVLRQADKSGVNLGVDTAFVATYGDLLQEMGIKPVLMTATEGKYSMYIDAVANTIAPSSYVDEQYPYVSLENDIRKRFPF